MNEKELWEKFYKDGKIADYLEYRNCVNMKNAELEQSAENNCTRTGNQRTEYR